MNYSPAMLHENISVFMSVPDNAVQTADLLVGVNSLIVKGQLLLERSSPLLHRRLPAVWMG